MVYTVPEHTDENPDAHDDERDRVQARDKQYRADILVFGRDARPLAVVECKRPETALDSKVLEQAVRYNMVLCVKYIIITNGHRTFIFRQTGHGYAPQHEVPSYEEMLK